jgi:dihydrodipicolinate synthase/N-acetylneuraminate lyase/uridine kinase
MKPKQHILIERPPRNLEQALAALLHLIFETHPGPVLVAVGGPGGTGKSTLAKALVNALEDATALTLDDYKTPRAERARRGLHGPHPDANDMALIQHHLAELRAGRTIAQPVYCRDKGEATTTRPQQPARFIIVDGEVATYPNLRELMDFAVYVDSDWRTQLGTRLTRDMDERGYSPDKVIATFLHSNLREFAQHGASSKASADLHLYAHHDHRLDIESIATEHHAALTAILEATTTDISIEGLIVPPTTPFKDDGHIDETAFVTHLEFLAENGIRRLLINGTTAEFFSLSWPERKQLFLAARRYFPGLILLNTASTTQADAIRAARSAEDYGADAIVTMPPYYYAGAPAEGVIEWMNGVADAVALPTVLYNFPRHTGTPITPDMLAQLNYTAIKDSANDPALRQAATRYLAGTSTRMRQATASGAAGFVSALAGCMPALYGALETALREQDHDRAEALEIEIITASEHLRLPCEIAAIKRQLARLLPAYPTHVRPPLQQATELVCKQ